jgi:hypothetical protein
LSNAGFKVQPLRTHLFQVQYHDEKQPVSIEITHATDGTTQTEIANFIAALNEREPDTGRDRVLTVLTMTQSIIAIGIPSDFSEADDGEWLDHLMLTIRADSPGLFEVEGRGFYDGGDLVFQW